MIALRPGGQCGSQFSCLICGIKHAGAAIGIDIKILLTWSAARLRSLVKIEDTG